MICVYEVCATWECIPQVESWSQLALAQARAGGRAGGHADVIVDPGSCSFLGFL